MNSRNLELKELVIVSQQEKTAKRIKFSKHINIIQSDDINKTGKSTLIKTIFHTLGADVRFHDSWKRINPLSILKVDLENEIFYFLRYNSFFGIFDKDKNLLDAFSGITKGLETFIRDFFNFKLQLIENNSKEVKQATPAFLYLPFYIDQDKGWTDSLKSFEALSQFKQDKNSILEFHTGIKPSEYYESDSKMKKLKQNNELILNKKKILTESKKDLNKDFEKNNVYTDNKLFEKEISRLVKKINILKDEQSHFKNQLSSLKDKEYRLKSQLKSLENNLNEFNKDYKYIEKNISTDGVDCPTCGTHFENSFHDRYEILKSAEECKLLIHEFTKDIDTTREKINRINTEFYQNNDSIKEIENILQVKKSEISFQDFIKSESEIKINEVFNIKLDEYEEKISKNLIDYSTEEEIRNSYLDRKHKKSIIDFYLTNLQINLKKLNITTYYDKLAISFTDTGSDLPRAILAYYYSILSVIYKYSTSTLFPLVIDSYEQQDQDESNSNTMYDFILNYKEKDSQLILGTVKLKDNIAIPNNTNIITLTKKRCLLNKDEYYTLNEIASPLMDKVIEKLKEKEN